jgi:predicted MarR family transcription regulator
MRDLTRAEITVLQHLRDGDTAEVLGLRLGVSWPRGNWVTTTLRRLARGGLVARTLKGEGKGEVETFQVTLPGRDALAKVV